MAKGLLSGPAVEGIGRRRSRHGHDSDQQRSLRLAINLNVWMMLLGDFVSASTCALSVVHQSSLDWMTTHSRARPKTK